MNTTSGMSLPIVSTFTIVRALPDAAHVDAP